MTTKLQAAMLTKIARSDYTQLNGGEPNTLADIDWVWANTIIEDAEDKGVFTSLLNEGLVKHSGGPKSDAGVTLTQAGFDLYKALTAPFADLSQSEETVLGVDEQGNLTLDGELLICRHDEGDCDTIDAAEPDMDHLSRALYAARECGELPPDQSYVTLPDGTQFDFERWDGYKLMLLNGAGECEIKGEVIVCGHEPVVVGMHGECDEAALRCALVQARYDGLIPAHHKHIRQDDGSIFKIDG